MIEGLHLAAGDHVLQIGTSLGFQTWLLQRGVVGWRGAGSAVLYGRRLDPDQDAGRPYLGILQ
ncbi:MAG: hypothetical protein QOG05_4866, partial [Streptosporangiaceae bacterium]|nr:hypothetical protein [Streptosporangiaceae bacterium]